MQKRFWNWKDDDLTADINQWLAGLIESGLYRGFDAVLGSTMDLTLNHDTTGYSRVDKDENPTDNFGIVVTKQNTVIQEYDEIIISIDPTPSDKARKDIIVVTHRYQEIVGGENANYSVIKGVEANSLNEANVPLPPDGDNQVVIGEIHLPLNCASLDQTGVVYIRPKQPNFAGHVDFIEKENGFFLTDLDARTNRLINLGDPIENQDAATKFYVDFAIANNVKPSTENQRGIAELANKEEAELAEDDVRIMTPLKSKQQIDYRRSTPTQAIERNDQHTLITPYTLGKAVPLLTKIYPLGTWNMDTAQTKTIPHNLPQWAKTVTMSATIVSDDGTVIDNFVLDSIQVNDTNIVLRRQTSGTFDNSSYSSTVGNRGFVVLGILVDFDNFNSDISVDVGLDTSYSVLDIANNEFTFDVEAVVNSINPLATIAWASTGGTGGAVSITGADALQAQVTVYGYGTYELTCTVTDNQGASTSDTITVNIIEKTNSDPIIDAIVKPASFSTGGTGGTLRADVSILASDPDGDVLTYSVEEWDILAGVPVANSSLSINVLTQDTNGIPFANPNNFRIEGVDPITGSFDQIRYFRVTVSDGNGGTVSQIFNIKVKPNIQPAFAIQFTGNENPSSLIYFGNLNIGNPSEVDRLRITIRVLDEDITGGQFETLDAIFTLSGSGISGTKVYSAGTHTLYPNGTFGSSLTARFELSDRISINAATCTVVAYNNSGNVLGSTSVSVGLQ